jgi:hypothetical protein
MEIKGKNKERTVEITVNVKYKVEVEGPRLNGLQIKEAAIAQGVPIELDFLLAEVTRPKEHDIIGDTDEVTVNEHSKFVVTADDDNSEEA